MGWEGAGRLTLNRMAREVLSPELKFHLISEWCWKSSGKSGAGKGSGHYKGPETGVTLKKENSGFKLQRASGSLLGWLKHRSLGPSPSVPDSVILCVTQGLAFLTLQLMPMLQIHGLHFEAHTLRPTLLWHHQRNTVSGGCWVQGRGAGDESREAVGMLHALALQARPEWWDFISGDSKRCNNMIF